MDLMPNITLLVDYKSHFGSKYDAVPYRSGFDKELLTQEFKNHGIEIVFLPFSEVDFSVNWKGKIVLYTSSEDKDVLYKSYIEDVVYGLELAGANVIPNYRFLRAHNNKVFMEILRDSSYPETSFPRSRYFGSFEELKQMVELNQIEFPCVLKTGSGAMSKGVRKAENADELLDIAKKLCSTKQFTSDVKEIVRAHRHQGYVQESSWRRKFIVQPLVQGLSNDWKLLIFGNKIFTLKRGIRKNDFRASGSHTDYRAGSESGVTPEMLDFAYGIFKKMNVPMLSFDLANDGERNYMIEYQALYFGTSTINMSNDYYERDDRGEWVVKKKSSDTIESLYAESVYSYLKDKQLI